VIRLSRANGDTKVEELWSSNRLRLHFGNAMRIGNRILGTSGDFGPAFFIAVDVETGEEVFRERTFGRSQMVLAGSKLVIVDEGGDLAIASAGPSGLTVHARAPLLTGNAWTPPTLVGTRFAPSAARVLGYRQKRAFRNEIGGTMKLRTLAALACSLVMSDGLLEAQEETPLSQLVVNLFQPERFLNAVGVGPNHTAHFQLSGGTGGNEILFLNAALVNQAIISQLTSLPLGSSSGGFTYSFNPEVGTFERTSESFGPSLAERALTNGRGKLNFGVNFQSSSFDSFEGKDLDSDELVFYLLHNDCCAPPGNGILTSPAFEGDLIQSFLSMSLKSQSVLFFLNYGITDRFDVSVVVPYTKVELEARNTATLQRLSTAINPSIHFFNAAERDAVVFEDQGSASGLGDIAVRAKWNFYRIAAGGLAAGFELRAPTGNEEDLLGLGTTQAKLSFIASTAWGRLSPHFNLGYKFAGDPPDTLNEVTYDELVGVDAPTNPSVTREVDQTLTLDRVDIAPDEFNFAAGFDIELAPKVTLAADLLGRRLIDAGRLREYPYEHRYRLEGADGNVLVDDGPVQSIVFPQLFLDPVSVNQIYGAVGAKVNVGSTFLLSFNLLFTLTEEGLRDDLVPIFGFDYVF
jgi:hypothetical protein